MFPGKAFDETQIGETFSASLTVTEAHLVLAAGIAIAYLEHNCHFEAPVRPGKMLVANRGEEK